MILIINVFQIKRKIGIYDKLAHHFNLLVLIWKLLIHLISYLSMIELRLFLDAHFRNLLKFVLK